MIIDKKQSRVSLKIIPTPGAGHVVSAPPVLEAGGDGADFACGQCGAVLLHAGRGQVHNLIIHCLACGSYNTTDA
jgi:predicted RNA-binding Zn-ribbon protein involved in translation (DUF1610 family)